MLKSNEKKIRKEKQNILYYVPKKQRDESKSKINSGKRKYLLPIKANLYDTYLNFLANE